MEISWSLSFVALEVSLSMAELNCKRPWKVKLCYIKLSTGCHNFQIDWINWIEEHMISTLKFHVQFKIRWSFDEFKTLLVLGLKRERIGTWSKGKFAYTQSYTAYTAVCHWLFFEHQAEPRTFIPSWSSLNSFLKFYHTDPSSFLKLLHIHEVARFLEAVFEISSKHDSAHFFQTFANLIHVKTPVVTI